MRSTPPRSRRASRGWPPRAGDGAGQGRGADCAPRKMPGGDTGVGHRPCQHHRVATVPGTSGAPRRPNGQQERRAAHTTASACNWSDAALNSSWVACQARSTSRPARKTATPMASRPPGRRRPEGRRWALIGAPARSEQAHPKLLVGSVPDPADPSCAFEWSYCRVRLAGWGGSGAAAPLCGGWAAVVEDEQGHGGAGQHQRGGGEQAGDVAVQERLGGWRRGGSRWSAGVVRIAPMTVTPSRAEARGRR